MRPCAPPAKVPSPRPLSCDWSRITHAGSTAGSSSQSPAAIECGERAIENGCDVREWPHNGGIFQGLDGALGKIIRPGALAFCGSKIELAAGRMDGRKASTWASTRWAQNPIARPSLPSRLRSQHLVSITAIASLAMVGPHRGGCRFEFTASATGSAPSNFAPAGGYRNSL